MQKRTKIIIGISIAVVLFIGLTIFFHKREASSESNTSEEGADVDQAENPSTEDESLTSNDDTENESETKETESANIVTIDANVSLKEVNSWESEGNIYVQVDGTISNNSNSVIDNWEARVPIDSSAVINDSWNMNYELDNGLLSITGVDHNESIPANSSVNFGMIIMNPGELDPAKARLIIPGETLKSDGDEDPSNSSNPDSSVTNNNQSEPKDVLPPKGSTNDDWLYTDGNKIINKDGKEVWLTGLNWFGYNTGTNTFDGLWTCDLNTSLSQIA
ncbi:MAG TPA: cellulose binding domain-containing protein, partial [Tissierellaceae bacterium]|nr:cellulose binding domain-containing protein [Tissierellaceae bacterium]